MRHQRLSQVARKLKVGTSTIIEVLESYGHSLENKPNTKVDRDQIKLLAKHFSKPLSELVASYLTQVDTRGNLIASLEIAKKILSSMGPISIWDESAGSNNVCCVKVLKEFRQNRTKQLVQAIEDALLFHLTYKEPKAWVIDFRRWIRNILNPRIFYIFRSTDEDDNGELFNSLSLSI